MQIIGLIRAALPVLMMIGAGIVVLTMIQSAKERERQKVVLETIETLKERDVVNGEVEALSLADLCKRLGGQWVSGSCQ